MEIPNSKALLFFAGGLFLFSPDRSIHFSTMAKRVQNNFLTEYIVTQTIVAMPNAPLALSLSNYIQEAIDFLL